jgi:hypothetical protein
MPESGMLHEFLDGGRVDAAVFALRPDYRALLLAVDGLARAQASRPVRSCSVRRRPQPRI